MVILDAFPLIALLADEPAAGEVEELFREHEVAVTTVNVAEACDVTQRRYGFDPGIVEAALDLLFAESLALLPIGKVEAWKAGRLRARYYDQRESAISLADCFLLAAAGPEDRIATSNTQVIEVACREHIQIVPLPDSSGQRP